MYRFWCACCSATLEMVQRYRPDGSPVTTHLVADEDGEYDCGPLHRVWWGSTNVEREPVG